MSSRISVREGTEITVQLLFQWSRPRRAPARRAETTRRGLTNLIRPAAATTSGASRTWMTPGILDRPRSTSALAGPPADPSPTPWPRLPWRTRTARPTRPGSSPASDPSSDRSPSVNAAARSSPDARRSARRRCPPGRSDRARPGRRRLRRHGRSRWPASEGSSGCSDADQPGPAVSSADDRQVGRIGRRRGRRSCQSRRAASLAAIRPQSRCDRRRVGTRRRQERRRAPRARAECVPARRARRAGPCRPGVRARPPWRRAIVPWAGSSSGSSSPTK